MASEVAEIIDRMILVIKSNGAIWDEKNREDKLHSIDYGEEDNLIYDRPAPYVLVTIPDSPYVTAEQYGRSTDTKMQYILEFVIKIISDTNSSENTERELSRLPQGGCGDYISGNRMLEHPTNTQSPDPKCSRLYITRYGILPQYRGKELQIAEIVVQCQIGSQWRITIPNGATPIVIDLLSKPLETPGLNLDTDRWDDASLVFTEIEKNGELHVEYENTFALQNTLQNIIDDANELAITLHSGTDTRNYNALLERMQITAEFDKIDSAVLHARLVS